MLSCTTTELDPTHSFEDNDDESANITRRRSHEGYTPQPQETSKKVLCRTGQHETGCELGLPKIEPLASAVALVNVCDCCFPNLNHFEF